MSYNPAHSQRDRQKHYHTWAAKPGNLEKKAMASRESYNLRASLGICVKCNRDARPGKKTCGGHR